MGCNCFNAKRLSESFSLAVGKIQFDQNIQNNKPIILFSAITDPSFVSHCDNFQLTLHFLMQTTIADNNFKIARLQQD